MRFASDPGARILRSDGPQLVFGLVESIRQFCDELIVPFIVDGEKPIDGRGQLISILMVVH
ncbi:hypothetical protein [Leucobacter komagatae]|uniref:hypothetical protein n=1 Tax=Leucobacter komagatae TaxID=55969 RepID=UPI000A4621A2|nr:hypothetical protein [Leucobacter komagatae]